MDTISYTPVHVHDCDNCIYLGTVSHYDKPFDLYFHHGKFETTVIARFGIDGDYGSGLCFASSEHNKIYAEAAERAYRLGHLTDEMLEQEGLIRIEPYIYKHRRDVELYDFA